MTKIKNIQEIEAMREGGQMLMSVLKLVKSKVVPGISTQELADIAKTEVNRLGGQPTFWGYQGFPDVLCVSINDEVVHGIPSQRLISEGDIVSLDFGVTYKALITDGAISFIVGLKPGEEATKLVTTTEAALKAGIEQVKDGCKVGDIAEAIQKCLEGEGLGVVRDLVGHGVGEKLHEEPSIPNFGLKGTGPLLQAGMTIAIEPMATLGGWGVHIEPDGWTVKTNDHSLSAHFEHTVLVSENGFEILTV